MRAHPLDRTTEAERRSRSVRAHGARLVRCAPLDSQSPPLHGQSAVAARWLWVAVAALIVVDMVFVHLGLLALHNPDEGRNASIAWEMQQSGSWLIPTYDGLPYMDKPALFFKLVAYSLTLFGHNEFAARLPSALSACCLLALVFWFCRKEYGQRTAVLAVAVTATTPLFVVFARYVIFDMMLALAVCAAIFAGYRAAFEEGRRQRLLYRLAAIAAGIAVLVKGPVGFVLPVLVLTVFYKVEGRRGAWRKLLSGENWLILGLVILPWFLGATYFRHDFPYYGIVLESLARFATPVFHRTGPLYYFLPVIILTFLPWSLLLPETLWRMWRRELPCASVDRLCLVWFAVTIVFFSLSESKRPGYVLTLAVASGILIARLFSAAFTRSHASAARVIRDATWVLTLLVLAALGAGVYYGFGWHAGAGHYFRDPTVPAHVQAFAFYLVSWLSVAALVALAALASRDPRAALAAFIVPVVLLPFLVTPRVAQIEQHASDRALAHRVAALADGADVACLGCFPSGMPFYLQRRVIVFTRRDGAEIKSNYIPFFLSHSRHWPPQVQQLRTFGQWLAARSEPVFLLWRGKRIPRWPGSVGPPPAAAHLQGGYEGFLYKPGRA